MADIFISHSGKDNEVAAAIGERIRRERPTWSLFYDKDNIRAGQRWQERLREELTSCRVVLALLSRNWLGSPWCFTEAVTATFRGKDVVGIETEDLTGDDLARAPPILHERQRVRLRDGDDRRWQEILEALDRSGLDPNDWFPIPPNVGPFPGLVAFDEKDAGVFFGRKQETTEYLGILDTLRGPDRSQVLVISGGSGCGKSSLLRAGLIPRLRRKPEWVVISPFEVAREPVRNLLERLSEALAGLGAPGHGLDLTKLPEEPGALAQILDETLRRLEQATGAWVLVPLDQAEALLVGDRQAGGQARLLLDGLAKLLGRRTRHAVVAATIRTEFVPRLEADLAGPEVRLRQAPLSAIGALAEAIEKPADRFGIELEPGLSERIVEDVRTADALPLLAYTLKALHDRDGADRRLTIEGYQTLGGVHGAIAAKLESVLSDPEPTAEETRGLQRAFTRYLIRVDEGAVEGERLLRRVVPRAALPHFADRVIGRLVDAGLLMTRNGTIELAHERLIDDWPKLPLKTWLDQDAADRRLIVQLRERVNDDTLPDGLLAQAEELLRRDQQLAVDEPALAKLVQRSRDLRRAREWRRRLLLGSALLVAVVVAVVAGFALVEKNEAQIQRDKARAQLLAIEARRADAEARSPQDVERVGALALESIEIARKSNRSGEADAIETARSALIRLPLRVLSHGGSLTSVAVLGDGRLASSGFDGNIKIWPKEGTADPIIRSHGAGLVRSLAVLADGRLASASDDGTIKLWPKEGEPVVLSHGTRVWFLMALTDGRLASAGAEGKIKLWPQEGTGTPIVRSHGSHWIYTLAVLADGRLASGGDDGIKLWPKEGTDEPIVRSHGAVLSLAVLADGRLASGSQDGSIKLWPNEGTGAPVVVSHGSAVNRLAVLADGRLASGGEDGNIKLWSEEGTGEPLVLPHGSPIKSLVVLPDGELVSAGADGTIKFWSNEPVVLPQGDSVVSLAALADGRLASASQFNGTVKLWTQQGTGKATVLLHGSPLDSLAALADGRLASGGEDGKIKLWPREGTGEPVVLSHSKRSEVRSLAVLLDGRLASGSDDGRIKLWLVDEQKLVAALCLRAGRNLTKDEWARYIGSDTPWQPSCRDLPSNWRTPD
jgi:WD40 repeat protein